MRFRLLLSMPICFLVPALQVSAATVSVLVVETGLPFDLPTPEFSRQWENGVMDGFFDGGHIVSNAPIARIRGQAGEEFPGEVQGEFAGAREGGADFMVLVLLDYTGYTNKTAPRPLKMAFRLFRVSPYQFIYEQRYSDDFPGPAAAVGTLLPRMKS